MKLLCGCCLTRRAFIFGSAALASQSGSAAAQEHWGGGIEGACSFYPNDVVEADIYTFGSTAEADDVVRRITDSVGLAPNFKVLQANVPNAAAVIRGTERYVLFSQVFIENIVRSASSQWASWTIVAHEVGHHLNGHTLLPGGSRPKIELEADRFAGHTVRRMGGSLDDALACYQQMGSAGSDTHPPRSARLESVARGWREAVGPATTARPPRQEQAPKVELPRDNGGVVKRVKANVSLGYLNMRGGPGTNYPAVTQIPAGSNGVRLTNKCVTPADGASKHAFCLVEWGGKRGWVSINGLE